MIEHDEINNIWNGKTIAYLGGTPPNDHGTVINTVNKQFDLFKGTVYRHMAPFDGKEAFVLDYRYDTLVPFMVDYIREVQRNLYLGIATIRTFGKYPLVFFLLEMS